MNVYSQTYFVLNFYDETSVYIKNILFFRVCLDHNHLILILPKGWYNPKEIFIFNLFDFITIEIHLLFEHSQTKLIFSVLSRPIIVINHFNSLLYRQIRHKIQKAFIDSDRNSKDRVFYSFYYSNFAKIVKRIIDYEGCFEL